MNDDKWIFSTIGENKYFCIACKMFSVDEKDYKNHLVSTSHQESIGNDGSEFLVRFIKFQ